MKETDRVQLARFEYWQLIRLIPAQDLVFLDESGVNLSLAREYARSSQGSRVYESKPSRTKNVSMVGAISLKKGLLSQWNMVGYMDALTFDTFISQKLLPELWPRAVLVMDNCSIHKSEEIEALIQSVGARIIYLPPYSPDFFPLRIVGPRLKVFDEPLERERIVVY